MAGNNQLLTVAVVNLNAGATLNSLANNQAALTDQYDNTTGLYIFGLLELATTFAVAPSAAPANLIDVNMVPSLDGANFGDAGAGASPVTQPAMYVDSFEARAVTTAQRMNLGFRNGLYSIYLPPLKFKLQIVNKTGQAFPASVTLNFIPVKYQYT